MTRYHRTVPGPDSSAAGAGETIAAPDPVHLIESFANTVSAASGTDLLSSREQAADWLRAMALLPAGIGLSGSEHGALLRLRDSLRDALAAHTGRREDADTAARLTRALADGRLVLTVDPASTVGLASAARASYSGVVAAIAVAVGASAASGAWLRLKSCDAPGCGQAFLDDSAGSAARGCPSHAQG
jgi:predicted RNA-binding Zn ribbon-like protein